MSVPPGERLPAARIASHLGVMAIVAAVMGVVVAGLAIEIAEAVDALCRVGPLPVVGGEGNRAVAPG